MAQVYPTPPNSPLAVETFAVCEPGTERLLDDETCETGSPGVLASPIVSKPYLIGHSEQETKEHKKIDLFELKSLLCLDNWQCGCPTTSKTPCKRVIAKKKRDEVDLQIASAVNLVQSSPEITDRLKSLAELVSCSSHSREHFIQRRVNTWIALFPVGDLDTSPYVLMERDIREALGPLSTGCVGETIQLGVCGKSSIEEKNCSLRIGGQKVFNCDRTINKIVDLVTHFRDKKEALEYFLKVLERNRQCEDHNESPFELTHTWYSKILVIQNKYQDGLLKAARDDQGKLLCGAKETPDSENAESSISAHNEGTCPTSGDLQSPIAPLNIDPAKFWTPAFDSSAFGTIEKHSLSGPQSLFSRLSEKIKLKLDENNGDLKEGYIYLYQVEGNEKFVKIGYTTRTLSLRHKEWEFACNRVPIARYPISPVPEIVPNARRVEALCHAELAHCRVRIYCHACLIQHTEWFAIDAADAIKTIHKWSKWMASGPYEERWLRSGSSWVLNSEEQKRIGDMGTFLEKLSIL